MNREAQRQSHEFTDAAFCRTQCTEQTLPVKDERKGLR